MDAISLNGRVAIITGAGRGLGRAYALAFAERGAQLVINDLGSGVDGSGSCSSVAEEVAALIRGKGGQAVAESSDVADSGGGRAIVRRALDAFGRLDIVVNNAGICRDLPFEQTTLEDFELNWRVHVGGHVNVTRAAWPIMVRQGHGRIIATASGAGLFGLRNQSAYSSAKGAIHGLMRTLSIEGADHGILVNCVCPGGFSRMHEAAFTDPAVLAMMRDAMPPELVAPAIVWLASDDCRVTGQELSVWSGRVARVVVGTGNGLFDRQLSPERIRDEWGRIAAVDGLYEARDGVDDVLHWRDLMA